MPAIRTSTSTGAKPNRRISPSCRGGASSLLRLTQPSTPRLPTALDLSAWVSRAVDAFGRSAAAVSR